MSYQSTSTLQLMESSEFSDYLLYSHDPLLCKADPTPTQFPPPIQNPDMTLEDLAVPQRSPARLAKSPPSPEMGSDTSSVNDTLDYQSDNSSQVSVFSNLNRPEEDEQQIAQMLKDFGYIYEEDAELFESAEDAAKCFDDQSTMYVQDVITVMGSHTEFSANKVRLV